MLWESKSTPDFPLHSLQSLVGGQNKAYVLYAHHWQPFKQLCADSKQLLFTIYCSIYKDQKIVKNTLKSERIKIVILIHNN